MISFEDVTSYNDRLERVVVYYKLGILFPPHTRLLQMKTFLEKFKDNIDNTISLDGIILNNLETCSFLSGRIDGNFYPLGLFVQEDNKTKISHYIKTKYPNNISSYAKGLNVPRFHELLSMSFDEIYNISLSYPSVINNKHFLLTWLREKELPLQDITLESIYQYIIYPKKERIEIFNELLRLQDIDKIREFDTKGLVFYEINLNYVSNLDQLEFILSAFRIQIKYPENIKYLYQFAIGKSRDIFDFVVSKYPDSIEDKSLEHYLLLAIKSKNFYIFDFFLKRVKELIGLTKLNNYGSIQKEAYLTGDRKIYENFPATILDTLFLTGDIKEINNSKLKIKSPIVAIRNSILSNSLETIKLAFSYTNNIPLFNANLFLILALDSPDSLIVKEVVRQLELKGVELVDNNKFDTIIKYVIKQNAKGYTSFDIDKIQVVMNFPGKNGENGTLLMEQLARTDNNDPTVLSYLLRYIDPLEINWQIVRREAETVLNYRIVWWVNSLKH